MCAGSDVILCVVGRLNCWISQEAEDGAGSTIGGKVGRGEEVADVKAYPEEVEEAAAEGAAGVGEGAEAWLIGGYWGWDRLLGFAVDELAKVKGSN